MSSLSQVLGDIQKSVASSETWLPQINDDVPAYLMELVSREYLNDIKAMNVARFCYKVSTMHLRDALALCIYVMDLLNAFA